MAKGQKIMVRFSCVASPNLSSQVAQTLNGNTQPPSSLCCRQGKRSLTAFFFFFNKKNFWFLCHSVVKAKQNNGLLCFTGA